jgi:hypothetical protein
MRRALALLLLLPLLAAPVAAAPQGPRIFFARGAELTLPGGAHQPVLSMLNITRHMAYGDFVWNEDGIPAGAIWVRVDLSRQLLSVFRGGHEIGAAVILFGTDGKPTPLGRFSILEKDAHHVSNLYDAPMPFMLRLTNDGVAIHAANVRQGWATHGCIGLPPDFAEKLFAAARRGDMVVIVSGDAKKA